MLIDALKSNLPTMVGYMLEETTDGPTVEQGRAMLAIRAIIDMHFSSHFTDYIDLGIINENRDVCDQIATILTEAGYEEPPDNWELSNQILVSLRDTITDNLFEEDLIP